MRIWPRGLPQIQQCWRPQHTAVEVSSCKPKSGKCMPSCTIVHAFRPGASQDQDFVCLQAASGASDSMERAGRGVAKPSSPSGSSTWLLKLCASFTTALSMLTRRAFLTKAGKTRQQRAHGMSWLQASLRSCGSGWMSRCCRRYFHWIFVLKQWHAECTVCLMAECFL